MPESTYRSARPTSHNATVGAATNMTSSMPTGYLLLETANIPIASHNAAAMQPAQYSTFPNLASTLPPSGTGRM